MGSGLPIRSTDATTIGSQSSDLAAPNIAALSDQGIAPAGIPPKNMALNARPLRDNAMKIVTDDPDWAPELYEARARAMSFVRKHGRWQRNAVTRLVARRNGLTVTYYPHRSPLLLTIDTSDPSVGPFARVLKIEWNDGAAWRMTIETYHRGRWQSRLKAMVYPRPWLDRWRALATFTGSLPQRPIGVSKS